MSLNLVPQRRLNLRQRTVKVEATRGGCWCEECEAIQSFRKIDGQWSCIGCEAPKVFPKMDLERVTSGTQCLSNLLLRMGYPVCDTTVIAEHELGVVCLLNTNPEQDPKRPGRMLHIQVALELTRKSKGPVLIYRMVATKTTTGLKKTGELVHLMDDLMNLEEDTDAQEAIAETVIDYLKVTDMPQDVFDLYGLRLKHEVATLKKRLASGERELIAHQEARKNKA